MGARVREPVPEFGAGRRQEHPHSRARQRNCGERRRPGHCARAAAQNLSAARLDQVHHFGPGTLRRAIDCGTKRRLGDGRERAERRRGFHHEHLSVLFL